jgi:hypothetical protein
MAQWWPLPTQNDEESRSLVRSVLDVFPYVTVWSTELHEMLVIGSMAPFELDAEQIRRRFERGDVAEALGEVGIDSPAALLATYVTGRAGLERYVDGALPVTDDRPRLEYGDWVRPGEIERVLPKILAEADEIVPLSGGGGAFQEELEGCRSRLFSFYAAGLAAMAGDRDAWGELIAAVMREEADNEYYRWILGR